MSLARNGHGPRHIPVHPYTALFPTAWFRDSAAAREAFDDDVVPKLSEIHGGPVLPQDEQYGQNWTMFAAGFAAAMRHVAEVQGREAREAMEK